MMYSKSQAYQGRTAEVANGQCWSAILTRVTSLQEEDEPSGDEAWIMDVQLPALLLEHLDLFKVEACRGGPAEHTQD